MNEVIQLESHECACEFRNYWIKQLLEKSRISAKEWEKIKSIKVGGAVKCGVEECGIIVNFDAVVSKGSVTDGCFSMTGGNCVRNS